MTMGIGIADRQLTDFSEQVAPHGIYRHLRQLCGDDSLEEGQHGRNHKYYCHCNEEEGQAVALFCAGDDTVLVLYFNGVVGKMNYDARFVRILKCVDRIALKHRA